MTKDEDKRRPGGDTKGGANNTKGGTRPPHGGAGGKSDAGGKDKK